MIHGHALPAHRAAPARRPDTTARGEEYLPHVIDRMVAAFGCDDRIRRAELWGRHHQTPGLLRGLRANAGFCHCEVEFNVYADFVLEDGEPPPCARSRRAVGTVLRRPELTRWSNG